MCVPIMFGTAAAAASGGAAATAATTGLFGVGGAFSLGTTLSTLGSAFGVLSSFNQANQYEDLANYQRQVADQRANIEKTKANDARNRGIIEENAHRRKVSGLKGKQRATLGSQLVEMDSGSASELQADTAMMGELDALTIRNNAQREAYYHESAANLESHEGNMQASGSLAKANSARNAGFGGIVGMAAPVASSWYDSKSALVQQDALVASSPKMAWNGKSSFDSKGYV